VMIFGQSGGGAKTSTVLAMPPGKGLFHRAAVQSGSALRLVTPEAGAATAEKLLKQLGIGKANMGDLQKVSWQQILEAQTAAGGNFSPVIGPTPCRTIPSIRSPLRNPPRCRSSSPRPWRTPPWRSPTSA
jgi:carboxylesterase type B